MASALFIPITETLKELRSLQKRSSPMISPRIKMLILMKEAGEKGISKRELMSGVGASSQSIQNWRAAYKQGGLDALVHNGRKGAAGRSSVFTAEEHHLIEQKLKDPQNGLAGYVELQQWIEEEFKKEIKYNTILKYAIRHFGSKFKVARKSHVKKDEEAVSDFKKNLRKQ